MTLEKTRKQCAKPQLTAVGVMKLIQELQALLEASEHRELPVKRILPEKQVEHRVIVDFAVLPVRVGHRDLVQVCKNQSFFSTPIKQAINPSS